MSIDNLYQKLNGELPVTREELLVLVSSWGRSTGFYTEDSQNKDIYIEKCEPKECYDLSNLDVSQITNMSNIFIFSKFNGDISSWDVSNVTNMSGMFSGAESFNQDVSKWDVSNVTNMSYMFDEAKIFNQDISNWDTSNVTNMESMFYEARNFNQQLNWNTSNVTSMSFMFSESFFNSNLNFNTENVIYMNSMFANAKYFNQAINFDTSNVIDMEWIFYNAKAFANKYNNGNPLPENTVAISKWLNENMASDFVNMVNINLKITKNEKTFNNMIKDFNIDLDSSIGKDLIKMYNKTQEKLKEDLNKYQKKDEKDEIIINIDR